MSTFDGIVEEFPDIRIDYFRQHLGRTPPAACFLSHIHSDHLLGLETLRMPFVYCSAATRKLLLQMEKYPHRVNFSKGILESRKQTYKHLKFILRALPLQTSVELELSPKVHIKVTLFDANHCPGAVMFLIEGDNRAILYTGDVRAESWWVNSIVRNPLLIPFATGLKRLDCLYLDTTFASHQDIYREFPSKAEGLAELTKKVQRCANNSVFYFRAWTLGYEDVWITLRNILDSQIHVDRYQIQLFGSIAQDGHSPALTGFPVGNKLHPGCLTQQDNVHIHSCEPGMACHRALRKRNDVVWITPIISRAKDGTEVAEVGAGGGGGDLYQKMEVDFGNQTLLEGLRLLYSSISSDPETIQQVEAALKNTHSQPNCQLVLDGLGLDPDREISIKDFVRMLSEQSLAKVQHAAEVDTETNKVIHFPFSRHSSYMELRELVEAFRPWDICPCTVSIANWSEELSMQSLFGDLCSGSRFHYDELIRQEVEHRGESITTATEGWASQQQVNSPNRTVDEHSQDLPSSQETEVFQEVVMTAATGSRIVNTASQDCSARPSAAADHRSNMGRVYNIWRATNNGVDTFYPSNEQNAKDGIETPSMEISETCSSYSRKREGTTLDDDDTESLSRIEEAFTTDSDPDGRAGNGFSKRRKAFEAAKACLDGNQENWRGLNLRSLGWKGHSEEESEL